jgi:hypothetical protein
MRIIVRSFRSVQGAVHTVIIIRANYCMTRQLLYSAFSSKGEVCIPTGKFQYFFWLLVKESDTTRPIKGAPGLDNMDHEGGFFRLS